MEMILEIGFVNLREEMIVSCVPVPHWCSGGNEVDAWTTEPAVVNLVHGGIRLSVYPHASETYFCIRYMNYVTYSPSDMLCPEYRNSTGPRHAHRRRWYKKTSFLY